MSGQRQASLCGHCNKLGTHSEEMCNQNPAGRFFGKPFGQIYTNPKMESTISARGTNKSTSSTSARLSARHRSSAIAGSRASPSSRSTTVPAKHTTSDYNEGYAAGYAAGLAAASAANASEIKKVEPSQVPKAPDRRALSCRSPEVPPESQAAVGQKWNDFGIAESERMASFKTAESREKQKEQFAQALADEKENPTTMNFKETYKQTFGTKDDVVGAPRLYKPPQPTVLPWNPAALPNATNPAANGPPPRRKAIPPHLRASQDE